MDQAMIDAAMQEAQDAKDREKMERLYSEKSSVEPSPDPRDAVRGQKSYKKGGGVTRADGIITKGHTRGKMV